MKNQKLAHYITDETISENDFLSFKFANKHLWFHAKNIAGSHVILRAEEVTEENIFLAATLAAELF